MKIVFDLQCLQGSSRYRGIGRYSLELTNAFIRQAPQHEIYLLLNNHDLDSLEFVYNEFNSLLPKDRIKLLTLPNKIADTCYHNTWRIQATETLVEAYLTNLAPDIVYILSLFEGLNNRTITSFNHLMTPYLKVITLYDLIPFIYSDFYLSKIRNKHFFLRKFQKLRKADLLISISEASAKEAIELFSLEKDKIINGSVGLEEKFRTYRLDKNKFKALALSYKINKKFIFYLGGNDFRKNILNLIKAFVTSPSLWSQYQLLIITSKKSIFLDEAIAQLIKPTPLSFMGLMRKFYGNTSTLTIQKILPPHATRTIHSNQKIAAKKQLGFQEKDFLICSFGYLTTNKLIDKIIENYIQLLNNHKNIFLVFVGDFSANHYKKMLHKLIKNHRLQEKVFFKYFTEQKIYEKYLIAADSAIQLRSFSRGEMSAALLDCLAYGIPTLINTHGAHQEIPDEVVLKISNTFTDPELAQSIERLCFDTRLREKLSSHGREYIGAHYHPAKIGQQFHDIMEHFYTHNVNFKEQHLIKKLGGILATPNEKDIQDITDMIISNRTRFGLPKLFIDITILFNKQKNYGISSNSFLSLFLKEILTASFDQLDVEAVHYQPKYKSYYSALQWVNAFFSLPTPPCEDYQLNLFAQDRLLIPFKQTLLQDSPLFERIKAFYFKRINTYFLIESLHDLSFIIDQITDLYEKNKSTINIKYFSYIKAMLCLVETTKVDLLIQEKWQKIEKIIGITLHFILLEHQQSLTQQIETILLEKLVMQSEVDNTTIFSSVC